jgi:hypothetical protein
MLESAWDVAEPQARAGEPPSKQPNAPTGHAFNCRPSTQRGRSVGLTPPCYRIETSRCYSSVTFSQDVGTKKVFAGWLGGIAASLRKARAAMHKSRRAGSDYAVSGGGEGAAHVADFAVTPSAWARRCAPLSTLRAWNPCPSSGRAGWGLSSIPERGNTPALPEEGEGVTPAAACPWSPAGTALPRGSECKQARSRRRPG